MTTFPDESMLLLHEDVFGSREVGHVPELDVVVGGGFVVGFLKHETILVRLG